MPDLESLKRVLTELKGEARNMRRDQLKKRLSPAEKEEEKEEKPKDEAAETVDTDGEGPAPKKSDEADEDEETEEKEEADPELARVLAKNGIK